MATVPCRSSRNQSQNTPKYTEDTGSVIGDTKAATKAHQGTESVSKRRRTEGTSTAQASTQVAGAHSSRVKGRRGHLKLMTEIPLDTLHEIFRKLEPVDLLHLSQANKNLRTVVMERSARYIWEEAFGRLYALENPPPCCPEDLNLAQYAHFLFTKKCMQCQTAAGCWSSWPLRLRVCWNCLQSEHFTLLYTEECYAVIRAKGKVFSPSYNFHKEGACHPKCSHTFIQTNLRKKGYDLFAKWEASQRKGREGELEQMRLKRQAAIFGRLEEAGWTESEVRSVTNGNVGKLPTFMRAKKLTAKDWDVLQPQLVKCLQQLKTARMEKRKLRTLIHHWKAFRAQFTSWAKKQNRHPCLLPSPIDLAFYEPFKSTIFTPRGDCSVEFSLDDIDRVGKEWTETRNKIIVSMLPEEYATEIDVGGSSQLPLLAVFMFRIIKRSPDGDIRRCHIINWICQEPIFIFSKDPPERSPSPEDSAIMAFLSKNKGDWPWLEDGCGGRPWLWDHERFRFHPEAHGLVKDMLSLLELDPRTTTVLQVWERPEKFKCLLCTHDNAGEWISAVDHQLRYHFNGLDRDLIADERWKVLNSKLNAGATLG